MIKVEFSFYSIVWCPWPVYSGDRPQRCQRNSIAGAFYDET